MVRLLRLRNHLSKQCTLRNIISVFLFFDLSAMENKNAKLNNTYKTVTEYIYSVFSTLLICMLVIFTAFTFFFRLVIVNGDSMYPTLQHTERIIISNFLYKPDYGDIIVLNKEETEDKAMIKRVIALPGDTVNIDFNSHIITINGKVIFENYEVYEPISEKGDFEYPLTVPEDAVYVLGDNRNNSIDSRYSEVGFVKLDEINGKALVRVFPFGNFNIY